MTPRRALIHALDRRGGRGLLAALGTWYARHVCSFDVGLRYHDDTWLRRVADTYLVDTSKFTYFDNDVRELPAFIRHIFESANEMWFHVYKPRPGDVIIDVGAGIGLDTLAFSRSVGPSGRVFSIEAHPASFRRLTKLCDLNRLTNTTCLQIAVTDRRRYVYMADEEHVANTTAAVPTGDMHVRVLGHPLDVICSDVGIEHIDFLKMNIEGGEREALAGMETVIRKTRYCCIACHDFRAGESPAFATRQVVIEFLKNHGFDVVVRGDDPRGWVRDHVHAVRSERCD